MIASLGERHPRIDASCFVARGASVLGDVTLAPQSSVWYGAVVRGDENGISIGSRTNIQDLCVLHVDGGNPLAVGDDVTVGHRAILHGCTVGDRVLIGMGAVVMNGARIGSDSIVAAGALVPEGAEFPPRSLAMGVPARVKRELTDEEVASLRLSAADYVETAARHIEAGLGMRL